MKSFLLILFIIFSTVFAQAQTRVSLQESAMVLRFYPNPARSFVTFDFDRGYDKGFSIQVFNVLGRKMYQGANLNQRTTINLTDFERGMYVYQLFDRTGRMVESKKFQVSK